MNISLKGFVDICVLTNGRESFKQVMQSLEAQKYVEFRINVIKNKSIVDACDDCLKISDSPYFIKVDDDMILHPMTLRYYYERLMHVALDSSRKTAIYGSIFWEPWNSRYCNILKAYDRRLVSDIGFKVDSRGKIDKIFRKDCKDKGYHVAKEKSIIGIHAACKEADNMKYCQLFGCTNDPKFSIRRKEIKYLDDVYKKVPLKQQLQLANHPVYNENKRLNTPFYQFVEGLE